MTGEPSVPMPDMQTRPRLVGSSDDAPGRLRPVIGLAELRNLQRAIEDVYVDDLLQRWIVKLVRATRGLEIVDLSASVRGTLALERASRAWALIQGRDFVVPEDIEELFGPIVAHRVLFTPSFVASTRSLGREEGLEVQPLHPAERSDRSV